VEGLGAVDDITATGFVVLRSAKPGFCDSNSCICFTLLLHIATDSNAAHDSHSQL